jgi:hypothetical protein
LDFFIVILGSIEQQEGISNLDKEWNLAGNGNLFDIDKGSNVTSP